MQPQSKKASTRSTTRKKADKNRVTVPAVPSKDLIEARAVKASPRARLSPDLQTVIAARAYELYQKRGRQAGHELDDWLEAEREVLGGSD